MESQMIDIEAVAEDQRTQQRPVDSQNVNRLLEVLKEGWDFDDPLVVFSEEPGDYILAHGHHRLEAYRKFGAEKAPAIVYEGDLQDAIDYSCKPLNARHGQPETREGRRRRVKAMLERHWGCKNTTLANHCGVSEGMIRYQREEIERKQQEPEEPRGKPDGSDPSHSKPTSGLELPNQSSRQVSLDEKREAAKNLRTEEKAENEPSVPAQENEANEDNEEQDWYETVETEFTVLIHCLRTDDQEGFLECQQRLEQMGLRVQFVGQDGEEE